jgi:hypothetical protein
VKEWFLVILLNPISELQHTPLPPKYCEPRSVPQLFIFPLFSPHTHIWVYQKAWEHINKAHRRGGRGTFPKWGPRLGYRLILNPLFWECLYPKALLYIRNLERGNFEKNKLNIKLYPNSSLKNFSNFRNLTKVESPLPNQIRTYPKWKKVHLYFEMSDFIVFSFQWWRLVYFCFTQGRSESSLTFPSNGQSNALDLIVIMCVLSFPSFTIY